ncbi:MAG TPA: GGDEF domain-containing phosphodiesterase, partial [Gammaproteobacteria bacterium]|nr:GGDEF domain-containing phosphodiesterase [Gammaproteobacteria bacterium]
YTETFCAEFAERLRSLVPPGAPIIRLSERRFVVLLRLESAATVMDAAARLTEDDQSRIEVGEDRLLVDLTLGIAVHPTHADDAASLFRRAELALKEARERELAFAVYSPDSTQQHVALWKLESDLGRAVQQGDIEVYFQPKIALEDRRVAGVEALLRWRSDAEGFIAPQQFIPLAERSGTIVPLTWLVLQRTVEAARSWAIARGAPFSAAVNVSPHILEHAEFFPRLEKVAAELDKLGVTLTVELTEDSLVRSHESSTAAALQRIRKLGVGISIDDFGKGYSSLTYLKQIPATEVKIDKAFVATVARDVKDRHIVKAVIELARALGLTVVAEGVDSDESLRAVAQLGCDTAQGFFIARPMRANLVGPWLQFFALRQSRFPARGVMRLE